MAAALKNAKVKTPQELVKKTKEAFDKIDTSKKATIEDVARYLSSMKAIVYGTAEAEPLQEMIAQLWQEMNSCHLLHSFVTCLDKLDFECKKDIVSIFNKILRREIGTQSPRMPTVDYICSKPEVLKDLVLGYEKVDVALNSGVMLRECLKHEPLAKLVLHDDELFGKFFVFLQDQHFDTASDAFSSFKDLLTNHKILAADFLDQHYDKMFDKFTQLLNSENYVTRRQSLKLLGELLLDRANFTAMTKYISDPDNLKLMMNMLRDKSKNIQFEAFHVFKVFVANPTKCKPIMDILLKNKQKLIDFLTKFHESRAEDDQFVEEKTYLIKQISDLA